METASKQIDMLGQTISCEAISEGEQARSKKAPSTTETPEEVKKFVEGQFELQSA